MRNKETTTVLLFGLWSLAAGMGLGLCGPAPQPNAAEKPRGLDLHGDPLPPGALARLGTVRLRHGNGVTCLALSPDGKTAVAGDWDLLRLWDMMTDKELRQFAGHKDGIMAVAFSPDGRRIASGGYDATVRLWETDTGKPLRQLQGHEGCVAGLAFSPDGQRLASISRDGLLYLWELRNGKAIRRFEHDPASAMVQNHAVFFAADGKTVISVNYQGLVRSWDTATGVALRPIRAQGQAAGVYAFAAHGKHLATSSTEGIRLWDLASGREVRRIASEEARTVDSLVFSPDGKRLASSSWDFKMRLWEVATGELAGRFEGHEGNCTALRFAPDGKTLVTASWDRTIRVWNVAARKERHPFRGHSGTVFAVRFSADGRTLVTAAEDRTVRCWQPTTGKEVPRSVWSLLLRSSPTLSPDRKLLAVVVHEQPTEAEKKAFEEELTKEAAPRSWIPTLTCTSLQLRDATTGKILCRFGRSIDGIAALAFSADGRTLAGSGGEGPIRLWDTATGKEIARLGKKRRGEADPRLALSPDGRTLICGNWDGTMRTWDVVTGKQVREFGKGQLNFLFCLAFTPDGKAIVTGSRDEPICIWNPKTGRKLRELTGHRGAVNALLFSPDGKTLASAGADGTVRLWEVATDLQRACFTGHRGRVVALAFSPDGRWLASGSSDTTALVWDVSGAER